MSAHWYERQEYIDQLILFGKAVQGVDPYRVIIQPDRSKCRSGYCSFAASTIAVNPTVFPVPANKQFLLTKALLIHEAGHRRHTSPETLPRLHSVVANVLEDERVDRRMIEEFASAGWFLRKLSAEFLSRARPIDETNDSPGVVIDYFLQLRWANRCGRPVNGSLSLRNRNLWERVEPIVLESWQAQTSQEVNRNAAKILGVLGLNATTAHLWSTQTSIHKEVM